ncbi:phage protein Gp27 family protein [Tropicimonas sp. S265A]|uniref:phage protein Gp27 family protein n=1 Tax=Tropicimonas sp. S265A TaxID=3415134 RepID=UPI003C7E9C0B
MPSPKKLDLIPVELKDRLAQELATRGFGDIVDVTEALNFWLEEEGLEIRVGKTAVGEFSKALKDQREAFSMAETLLADMDIEQESDLHKVLMQMIATSAVQMMKAVREQDGHLEAKELMSLGRMLKDLMQSAGIREKIMSDERERIAVEARKNAADGVAKKSTELGLSADTVEAIKAQILGVS